MWFPSKAILLTALLTATTIALPFATSTPDNTIYNCSASLKVLEKREHSSLLGLEVAFPIVIVLLVIGLFYCLGMAGFGSASPKTKSAASS